MQKHVNFVDLAKSFPTNSYLQNWLRNQGKVRYRTFQLSEGPEAQRGAEGEAAEDRERRADAREAPQAQARAV